MEGFLKKLPMFLKHNGSGATAQAAEPTIERSGSRARCLLFPSNARAATFVEFDIPAKDWAPEDLDVSSLFPDGAFSVRIPAIPGTELQTGIHYRLYVSMHMVATTKNTFFLENYSLPWSGHVLIARYQRNGSHSFTYGRMQKREEPWCTAIVTGWIRECIAGGVFSAHIALAEDQVQLTEEVWSTRDKHVWAAKDIAKNRRLIVKATRTDLSIASINDAHRLWMAFNRTQDPAKQLLAAFITYAMTSHYKITVLERLRTSLAEFMRTPGVLPLLGSQVRAIGLQIITGIDFIHRMGVVHTDIKPENVALINPEMVSYIDLAKGQFITKHVLKYPLIKIVDYDEAFVTQEQLGRYSIGTMGYRAPEAVLGPSWSFGVDVFSFACLMAEIHIGRPLFPPTSTPFGYLTWLERLLGRLPLAFLIQLRANGHQSLLTERDELRRPMSDEECADIKAGEKWQVLAVLVARPDLYNLLHMALSPHEATRPTARVLMGHRYFKV
ncbi:hypothetical protein EST38_g1245 [Candolleomyces aberdarensis]|uniref:Protein kinase domain-containing protein n=1 Tax=Candolleomyces aberdarensis TaxID=2316362 RepID=A0A4Q2DVZ0_9AGAR|nr:hypothetical protein EST38_g1245 [Candolleomyces aberdarensis]